jgi:molybdenum cofactor cytidylyltransferase
MDLVNAFRLTNKTKAAIVGSGGKTAAMFQLARDFGSRVILSTTTHLAQDQLMQADRHITLEGLADLPSMEKELAGDILLFTGPEIETNRVKGPDQEILVQLSELADRWECPLLIEADGARQLPIKAPADHEPAIPEFVDTVIVVAGLSGLGKPLNENWVHRPEIFSDLVGVPLGSEVTSQLLAAALTSSRGGLKNIPASARKLLLINQLDSFPNWRTFHDHVPSFLSHYHAVGFAVLEDQMLLELHEPIAGVILAAGGSTRFGTTKQLLDWKGKPLVNHAAETALEGGLSPVLVVTGADQSKVTRSLENLPVECAYNPDWEQGQSSSVRTGIEALPLNIGAVIFLLVDQPCIPPELIRRLVKAHAVKRASIIHPQVNDERANPVLFDREVFQELSSLEGDTGGRVLFNTYSAQVVPWDNDLIRKDIDTPEDYEILRSAGE